MNERTDNFVAKAKSVHNDTYDYSKAEYVNAREKLVITCKIHGDFLQAPRHHLSGCGCPKCSRNDADSARTLNTEEFIVKAKQVHEDTYDYSSTVYSKSSEPVTIICEKHGKFIQRASHHLGGRGCPLCGTDKIKESNTSNSEKFIRKAINIHGNLYDYTKVLYKDAHSNVDIVCKYHGEFKQTPSNHLQGHGCPECAKNTTKSSWTYTGWEQAGKESKHFEGFTLYVLKLTDENGEEFIKIGKTFTSLSRRFKRLPYKYEVLYTYSGTAKEICELETRLHKDNKEYRYKPSKVFGGCYECYSKADVLGFWYGTSHGSMMKNGLINKP